MDTVEKRRVEGYEQKPFVPTNQEMHFTLYSSLLTQSTKSAAKSCTSVENLDFRYLACIVIHSKGFYRFSNQRYLNFRAINNYRIHRS